MPRPLFDSPYLFGFHDPGGESIMAAANRRGWIVFTVEVGSDPNDFSGMDFTPWANQDFGILCRINNGYGAAGTIPYSGQYADFAQRIANFVAASQGCKIWIIGNEMNHSQEWPAIPGLRAASGKTPAAAPAPQRGPDADPNGRGSPTRFSALNPLPTALAVPGQRAAAAGFEKITPDLYANCFRQCRDAIKLVFGHGDDQVVIGAVAPWNNQTTYPGNPNGDWVQYLADILAKVGAKGLDGIALHTYTHGSDPALVTDAAKMNAPFQNRYYNFLAYRDFMSAIPAAQRELPVYITETDQDVPWLDQNTGWVQAAYAEINWWNQQPGQQQIRSLALYRWPPLDQWYIQGKQGVIDDFRAALRNDYRWKAPLPKPADFKAGDSVETLDIVNFRQSPGGPTLAQLPMATALTVVSSQYMLRNGLVWWNLRRQLGTGTQDGWIAQFTGDGIVLLAEAPSISPPLSSFAPGDKVRTTTIVRMRTTPGVTNKPAGDIVTDVPQNTILTVTSGPSSADGMTWWRNQGVLPDGRSVTGWQAEALPDGTRLLEKTVTLIPPSVLPSAPGIEQGDRFRTTTLVRVRKSPGSTNKPNDDIVAELPAGTLGLVLGGPSASDDMTWWNVTAGAGPQVVRGWMAEALPDGTPLMESVLPTAATFARGDQAVTSDFANVRRSAGFNNKPADDVIGMFAPNTAVVILGGPETKDELAWWTVGGILTPGGEVRGVVAETVPGNVALLTVAPPLPGTNIPDKSTQAYLNAPFDGPFGIAQLWGENPDFYAQFNYDGVALHGHNGIDFLTPTGTLVYAVDGGEVAQAGFEPGGFGNYILLRHPWGESIYAHLDSAGVAPGQVVGRGQFIGRSGNTGASSGPHLHFAIRINPYNRADGWGGFSNPLPYLPPGSYILPPYVLDAPTAVFAAAIAAALPGIAAGPSRDNPSGMGETPGEERP